MVKGHDLVRKDFRVYRVPGSNPTRLTFGPKYIKDFLL